MKLLEKAPQFVDLNLGGVTTLRTTLDTLTKYSESALAQMMANKYYLRTKDKKVFIDRDATAFRHLINYLRTDKLPYFRTKIEEADFLEELDYWQIPNVCVVPLKAPFSLRFDEEWCAQTLSLDPKKTILKKENSQHGIVFMENAIDENCNFVEFSVVV